MIEREWLSKLDRQGAELLGKGLMVFVLKIIGAGLAFLLQIIIARQFGASGAGIYFLVLTVTIFAAFIARLGMDNPVTRFVATHVMENEYGKVLGVVTLALRLTFFASFIVATLVYLSADLISDHLFEKPQLTLPLRYMAIIIIPLAVSVIYAKALQGLKRTSETVLILGFFTPLMACFGLYVVKPKIGITGAVIVYGLAVVVTMVFASFRWYQARKNWKDQKLSYSRKVLFDASWPIFGAGLIEQLIHVFPLLVLGVWVTINEVGLFAIAQRTTGVLGLLLMAANVVLAPKMAELFKAKDMLALAKITRYGGLIVTGFASPVIIIFLMFPEWVMGLFGDDFVEAWLLLVIMSVGQLVNLMTGSVAFLLMMTGHERFHLYLNLISALLCILLSLALIPFLGAAGAAISSAVPLIIVNLLRAYLVKKKLGISLFTGSVTLTDNKPKYDSPPN